MTLQAKMESAGRILETWANVASGAQTSRSIAQVRMKQYSRDTTTHNNSSTGVQMDHFEQGV